SLPGGARFPSRLMLLLAMLVTAAGLLLALGVGNKPRATEITMSELARIVERGEVRAITVADGELLIDRVSGEPARVVKEPTTDVFATLNRAGVSPARSAGLVVSYAAPRSGDWVWSLAMVLLPTLLICGV